VVGALLVRLMAGEMGMGMCRVGKRRVRKPSIMEIRQEY